MTTQRKMDPFRHGPLYRHMMNPAPGQIFYVHRASDGGDDDNDGRTPETALLTITEALDRCTTGQNDYIFVIRHDPATETWPIAITKSYVHLIGTPFQGSPTPAIITPNDTHCIDIQSGGGVEIAGIAFGAPEANQDACINDAGSTWMNHVHHCDFAWSTEAYDCIRVLGSSGQALIHNNRFGAHGFTNYAILTDAPVGRLVVRDNIFVVNGNVHVGVRAIQCGSANQNIFKDNDFHVPDLADGEAITISGSTNWAVGNRACNGAIAMGFNPYRDPGGRNHWGINYANIAPTLPTTV